MNLEFICLEICRVGLLLASGVVERKVQNYKEIWKAKREAPVSPWECIYCRGHYLVFFLRCVVV